MKRHTKIIIGVVTLTAIGATALAASTYGHRSWHGGHGGKGRHAMAMMERFDADQDGKVTQAEIDQVRQDQMARFDSNSDGALTLPEFEGLWLDFMRERMVDRFQDLDADGDGQMTAAEMEMRLSQLVRRMDRNEDGVIDRSDMRRGSKHHGQGRQDDRED